MDEPQNNLRHHIKRKLRKPNISETRSLPPEVIKYFGYANTSIITDEEGFIINKNFIKRTQPIYLLGDSFVENIYARDGNRLADVTDKEMRDTWPEAYVYNGGMSGSSLLNLYNLFVNLILPNSKAVTVFFPGAISRTCNKCENTFWNRINEYSPFIDYHEPKIFTRPGDNFQSYLKILEMLFATAKIFSMRIAICVPPYNRLSELPEYVALNAATRNFCTKKSCPCLDMDSYISNNSHLFYDKVHLTEIGAQVYGAWLAKNLVKLFKDQAT